jgi:hypothetical protein
MAAVGRRNASTIEIKGNAAGRTSTRECGKNLSNHLGLRGMYPASAIDWFAGRTMNSQRKNQAQFFPGADSKILWGSRAGKSVTVPSKHSAINIVEPDRRAKQPIDSSLVDMIRVDPKLLIWISFRNSVRRGSGSEPAWKIVPRRVERATKPNVLVGRKPRANHARLSSHLSGSSLGERQATIGTRIGWNSRTQLHPRRLIASCKTQVKPR